MELKSARSSSLAVRAFRGHLLDLFFPPHCLVCRRDLLEPESQKEQYAASLCAACAPQQRLPASAEPGCSICGEPGGSYGLRDGRCLPCILLPRSAERIISLWPYAGNAKRLITHFKYGRRRGLAEYLACAIAEELAAQIKQSDALRSAAAQQSALLLAVPSPGTSLRMRGFSHLGILLRQVSRRLEIPCDAFALRSLRNREPQAGVPLRNRALNVGNSFTASPRRVAGRSILLIDDVLTTGASISAAARALREAGAATVIAATLARSPRFQTNRVKAFVNVT